MSRIHCSFLIPAALVLAAHAASGQSWQQDISPGGSTRITGISGQSLRREGAGVALLVEAIGAPDRRIARVSGPDAPLTWAPAEFSIEFPFFTTASEGGWLERFQPGAGFPGLPLCHFALRDGDGVIRGQQRNFTLGACDQMLFDQSGAVISTSDVVIAFNAVAEQQWQVQLANASPVAVAPVATRSGSVWIAAVGRNLPNPPMLIRLDRATGAEQTRLILNEPGAIRALRTRGDGGAQAILQLGNSGVQGALLVATGPDGPASTSPLLPAGSEPVDFQAGEFGIGACWHQRNSNGQYRLHAAVVDTMGTVRWSRELESTQQYHQCQIEISPAGRAVIRLPESNAILRLRSDGSLAERLQGAAYPGALSRSRMLFTADESLWLTVEDDFFSDTSARLLRFAGDQIGPVRLESLIFEGHTPGVLSLRPRTDGSAEVLLQHAQTQELSAFRADRGGVQHRPVPRNSQYAAEFSAGRLYTRDSQLTAVSYSGASLWTLSLLDGHARARCTGDDHCGVLQVGPKGGTQVQFVDPLGQVLSTDVVPGSDPQLFLEPRSDRLYLMSREDADRLWQLTPAGLQERVNVPSLSYSTQIYGGAPFGQLLRRESGALRAYVGSSLLWSVSQSFGSTVVEGLDGEPWELQVSASSPAQIAPLDASGMRRWSLDTSQWRVRAISGLLAGRSDRIAWLGSQSTSGLSRQALRIIDQTGTRERRVELDDASYLIQAIATTDADETAVIAYPMRDGALPRLRIRMLQQSLFADGLED